MPSAHATILAGVPAHNLSFYRAVRFRVGDPAALISIPGAGSIFILRDIEIDRARRSARAGAFASPKDFAPPGGLSGDRETATAQAAAECLRRRGVTRVIADRTLPLIFAHYIRHAGIDVVCDPDIGVLERRAKDEQEVAHLRIAQRATEEAIEMVCRTIARAEARGDGSLHSDGAPLTSERLRQEADIWLLRRGYTNPPAIIACGPQGADCHDRGSGPLYTEQPVIVDIFPQSRETLYCGDCTRTVVHGKPGNIPAQLRDMHSAVVEAKRAAIGVTRAGATGEQVHGATTGVITARGFRVGLPGPTDPPSYCAMVHGTGHGVGLEVHEPPLLDKGGPPLVAGDCLTIEPGLYSHAIGGVRVEDMVIVRESGCENLNALPEGLTWD
ncbi:MAG TPA: hypothetical protein DEB06_00830 [Phycisphaerales bacterium]|nr:hypothetical protein [Phycisphaerales bacterium]